MNTILNGVCNGVTHGEQNGVRRSVQNQIQIQNQSSFCRGSLLGGSNRIRSNGYLRSATFGFGDEIR